MGANTKEFESFEQQFVELICEFQSISSTTSGDTAVAADVTSESQLREELRSEASRAEAAEAAKDTAARVTAEARANAAAATAGATQAAKALATIQDELATVKLQLDLSERQRVLFEEKCTEMATKINTLEREVQQLRPLQSTVVNLQRQYIELQERTQNATEEARTEATRLETELRRVERCANAGAELRERARLAAAAHARERRLAAAELRHNIHELHNANAEIARMGLIITELQCQLSKQNNQSNTKLHDSDSETVKELRAALEAERAGTDRLERVLASALADNASLAAQLHINDNLNEEKNQAQPVDDSTTNICSIDSFLAD